MSVEWSLVQQQLLGVRPSRLTVRWLQAAHGRLDLAMATFNHLIGAGADGGSDAAAGEGDAAGGLGALTVFKHGGGSQGREDLLSYTAIFAACAAHRADGFRVAAPIFERLQTELAPLRALATAAVTEVRGKADDCTPPRPERVCPVASPHTGLTEKHLLAGPRPAGRAPAGAAAARPGAAAAAAGCAHRLHPGCGGRGEGQLHALAHCSEHSGAVLRWQTRRTPGLCMALTAPPSRLLAGRAGRGGGGRGKGSGAGAGRPDADGADAGVHVGRAAPGGLAAVDSARPGLRDRRPAAGGLKCWPKAGRARDGAFSPGTQTQHTILVVLCELVS